MKNRHAYTKDQSLASVFKDIIQGLKSFTLSLTVFFTLISILINISVHGANYYSNGNQTPNNIVNWWSNSNGTGTHPANFTNGDVFIIQNGHSRTTTANWTVSGSGAEIVINGGGSLTSANTLTTAKLTIKASGNAIINSAKTLKITNGSSSPDLFVQGTLTNAGTITINTGATCSFDAGGIYRHTRDGGTIPDATWNRNSICEIQGITVTTPDGLAGQTFGNFIWDCVQTVNIQLGGDLTAIAGNFTVENTGSAQLRLTNATNLILTVGGDFNLNGGTVNFSNGSATTKVFNLGGSFSQTGGTFTNSNSVPLAFNFTGTGMTFSTTGTLSNTYINWIIKSGASLSLLNKLPVATSRSCTVNGTLNCNILAVNGAGSFILSNGGALQIGSPDGIEASGNSGNILVTDSRSYSTGANYTYSSATGTPVTGDGLPETINNLTVTTTSSNPLMLTNKSLTVTGNMTINSGSKLELGSSDMLTVHGNTSLAGSECFILKATSSGMASFVNYGSISGSGTAKVDCYVVNNWDWHFISSPVTAQPIWNTTTRNFVPVPATGNIWTPGTWNWDFYRWAPQGDPNGYSPFPWVNLRNANGSFNSNAPATAPYGFGAAIPVFQQGTGYLVAYSSTYGLTTPYFSGTLNTGTFSIPLVVGSGINGHNQSYTNNLNLIGNPYPSALDFDALCSANSGKLSSSSYWIMLGSGTYASYTVGSGGTAGASRYISSMQGFEVTAASSSNLSFTNLMRTHNSQVWLKSDDIYKNRLIISVINDVNNLSDEVIVHFDPSFSSDAGAIEIPGFAKDAPNLFTEKDSGHFTINQLTAIDETTEVPLSLIPGVDAQYTFDVSGIETFEPGTPLLLRDLVTGTITDLHKCSSYSFAALTGDNAQRFVLYFGLTIGVNELTGNTSLFKIFINSGILRIENTSGVKNFQVNVYDMHGSLQLQQSEDGAVDNIKLNVARGMYIVRVVSDKGIVSKKVFVM
jgi:hypothetical protein